MTMLYPHTRLLFNVLMTRDAIEGIPLPSMLWLLSLPTLNLFRIPVDLFYDILCFVYHSLSPNAWTGLR